MMGRDDNIVLEVTCRAIVPFILLFALYVVTHGHYSPGGGFQGGAILAATAMLLRLSLGEESATGMFPSRLAPIVGTIGVSLFGLVGVAAIIGGGNYLDYSFLPSLAGSAPEMRYLGILVVEMGIALGVFGILLTIFDNLVGEQ